MNRAEHLAWCKKRAHEYLARGDIQNAIASMLSDLDKHPETKLNNPFLSMAGIIAARDHDTEAARLFIDGFN